VRAAPDAFPAVPGPMKRLLTLLAATAVAACNSPSALDDRWADPATIEYAAALNVDLSQMTLNESGLYWQDLVVGTGMMAESGHDVYVHWTGWLPDGTMVERTRDVGGPRGITPLGAGLVIRGLDEGIVGMNVGGTRKLVIPPELAWGRTGKSPVPPLATLIFDVELMHVVP
jgi:FKBP-type peptidyl-prolyl cis-trans isomerase FkpA